MIFERNENMQSNQVNENNSNSSNNLNSLHTNGYENEFNTRFNSIDELLRLHNRKNW